MSVPLWNIICQVVLLHRTIVRAISHFSSDGTVPSDAPKYNTRCRPHPLCPGLPIPGFPFASPEVRARARCAEADRAARRPWSVLLTRTEEVLPLACSAPLVVGVPGADDASSLSWLGGLADFGMSADGGEPRPVSVLLFDPMGARGRSAGLEEVEADHAGERSRTLPKRRISGQHGDVEELHAQRGVDVQRGVEELRRLLAFWRGGEECSGGRSGSEAAGPLYLFGHSVGGAVVVAFANQPRLHRRSDRTSSRKQPVHVVLLSPVLDKTFFQQDAEYYAKALKSGFAQELASLSRPLVVENALTGEPEPVVAEELDMIKNPDAVVKFIKAFVVGPKSRGVERAATRRNDENRKNGAIVLPGMCSSKESFWEHIVRLLSNEEEEDETTVKVNGGADPEIFRGVTIVVGVLDYSTPASAIALAGGNSNWSNVLVLPRSAHVYNELDVKDILLPHLARRFGFAKVWSSRERPAHWSPSTSEKERRSSQEREDVFAQATALRERSLREQASAPPTSPHSYPNALPQLVSMAALGTRFVTPEGENIPFWEVR